MTVISQTISCNQEIASDGAFTLGMLAQFSQQIEEFGASRYKELYWEMWCHWTTAVPRDNLSTFISHWHRMFFR
ncbi:MAG: hypothetical protein Q9M36_12715 [Sulfurovum sp.]|nr:hypothetical protein [Sulfurovum sp.]